MKQRQFRKLLKRYKNGNATGEEKALIEGWYNFHVGLEQNPLPDEEDLQYDLDKIWDKVTLKQKPIRKINSHKLRLVAAVALFIVVSTSTLIYFFSFFHPETTQHTTTAGSPSSPGQYIDKYDAYIQLGSGIRVNLDSITSGHTFSYDKISLNKDTNGTLIHQSNVYSWDAASARLNIHTVYVPKAKQSKIILSDGTQVWLNSQSSISFPEAFSWNERRVEISGEVYFEVKKDSSRPFYVKTKDALIKVLGTSFNVSSYADEPTTSTTLVSGSVSVSPYMSKEKHNSARSSTLTPGQQWIFQKDNQEVSVRKVDTEGTIAWKNGLISFTNLDLPSIMRKAARWYDVEVEYASPIQKRRFTGGISSRTTLDEFIRIMGFYQVKIELQDGRKLIVSDN